LTCVSAGNVIMFVVYRHTGDIGITAPSIKRYPVLFG